MTEAEWLACTTPKKMLEFLRETANDRKLRLFAVACCRRIWLELSMPSRKLVEVAERYADGLVTDGEKAIFGTGAKAVEEVIAAYPHKAARAISAPSAFDAAYFSAQVGAAT